MLFDISDLAWLVITSLLMGYWWSAKGAKERALKATRRHCREMELQLLDDNIALRGLWFKRDPAGRLRCWRSYNFEFSSTGEDRYQGRIVLLGLSIEGINLQPHRIHH